VTRPPLLATFLLISFGLARAAAAQTVTGPPATAASDPPATVTPTSSDEDDQGISAIEPDVVVVNLPTGMRLPLYKSNFRLTHRFAGNLRRGSFGRQAGNLFGLDQGAIIGFEYRVAVAPRTQFAFYRSSFDKTIQLHGAFSAMRQRGSAPVSVTALGSIEGANNFKDKYEPAVGVVISRSIHTRLALYATPMWVDNTAASLAATVHDHDHDADHGIADESPSSRRSTTVVGVGMRVRVGGSTTIAGEVVPRVSGYAPDEPSYGISIEKRVGGHMFSLTFTNSFGTTFAQVARGGASHSLFLGFNLGRKFY
jgi:hypothetical protein